MKKFSFSLESVLRVREFKERQALREVAAVQSRINGYLSEMDKIKNEFTKSENQYLAQQSGEGYWIDGAKMFNGYLSRLNDDNNFFEGKIEELQPLLKEAQQKYLEANKQKKIVEILKVKQKKAYDYKFKKEIQEETDEINNQIYSFLSSESKAPKTKSVYNKRRRELDRLDKLEQVARDMEEEMQISKTDLFQGFRGRKR